MELVELFALDDASFRQRFRKTALWRPRRRGLLRNAAIVLGNRPSPAGLKGLVLGLDDAEPLVRAACAWALGRHKQPEARKAIELRRKIETDPQVIEELNAALA